MFCKKKLCFKKCFLKIWVTSEKWNGVPPFPAPHVVSPEPPHSDSRLNNRQDAIVSTARPGLCLCELGNPGAVLKVKRQSVAASHPLEGQTETCAVRL